MLYFKAIRAQKQLVQSPGFLEFGFVENHRFFQMPTPWAMQELSSDFRPAVYKNKTILLFVFTFSILARYGFPAFTIRQ